MCNIYRFNQNYVRFCAESLPIKGSEAKSWHADGANRQYAHEKAYDGDIKTVYLTKDGDVTGNFLKLYLFDKYRIGTVMLTNRKKCCQERIIGTVVMVYTTEGGTEAKVADCGGEIAGTLTQVLIRKWYPLNASSTDFY